MINQKTMLTSRKSHYFCELKIDERMIDKRKTDNYEVWNDEITEKIYEVNRFKEIKIIIRTCNS
ncbi:MAG: hypothetical protein KJI71_00390 [Patescibacteria group bacterium]|nr:hypothetical protein [Patescibacteria group bacterium]